MTFFYLFVGSSLQSLLHFGVFNSDSEERDDTSDKGVAAFLFISRIISSNFCDSSVLFPSSLLCNSSSFRTATFVDDVCDEKVVELCAKDPFPSENGSSRGLDICSVISSMPVTSTSEFSSSVFKSDDEEDPIPSTGSGKSADRFPGTPYDFPGCAATGVERLPGMHRCL